MQVKATTRHYEVTDWARPEKRQNLMQDIVILCMLFKHWQNTRITSQVGFCGNIKENLSRWSILQYTFVEVAQITKECQWSCTTCMLWWILGWNSMNEVQFQSVSRSHTWICKRDASVSSEVDMFCISSGHNNTRNCLPLLICKWNSLGSWRKGF